MDQHPVKHGLLISVEGSHAKHCLKVGRNGVDAGFGVGVRILPFVEAFGAAG
jgi:hypothetical protein